MTTALAGQEVARQVSEKFPNSVIEASDSSILVKNEALVDVANFLKSDPGLDLVFLNDLSAVDYFQDNYFEVTYRLSSLAKNHTFVVKARAHGRENPTAPSVTGVWRAANMMEREVYDLMGVNFSGHPNMKRVFLWAGFKGHPLRKDFVGTEQQPCDEETT